MRHIYVASSWRNEFQPDVVRFLRSLGHAVYDFRNPRSGGAAFDNAPENGFAWRQIGLDHATCTPAEYRKILTTHPTAEQGFAAAGVAYFFKQHGGRTHAEGGCLLDGVEHKAFPEPRREMAHA